MQMATRSPSVEENAFWIRASSLEGAARELLLAAARSAWPYARRSAWSYLHDESLAAELLEKAVEKITPYVGRASSLPSSAKVLARLRSEVRRLAKQEAHRRRFEEYRGTVLDLELLAPTYVPNMEERLLLEEFLNLVSPYGRIIAQGLRLGYTWREIADDFNTDHSAVRRAFRREADAALLKLRNQHRPSG